MALRLYLALSGIVFALVALLHLGRLVNGWTMVVGPYPVPLALSYVGLPVAAAYSAWAAWLLISRRDQRGRDDPH